MAVQQPLMDVTDLQSLILSTAGIVSGILWAMAVSAIAMVVQVTSVPCPDFFAFSRGQVEWAM